MRNNFSIADRLNKDFAYNSHSFYKTLENKNDSKILCTDENKC
ncbi:MAG: hypothetical protein RL236_1855 [Pseudomonadota bacterium]